MLSFESFWCTFARFNTSLSKSLARSSQKHGRRHIFSLSLDTAPGVCAHTQVSCCLPWVGAGALPETTHTWCSQRAHGDSWTRDTWVARSRVRAPGFGLEIHTTPRSLCRGHVPAPGSSQEWHVLPAATLEEAGSLRDTVFHIDHETQCHRTRSPQFSLCRQA